MRFNRRYPGIQALPPPERPDCMFLRLFGAVRAPAMLADLLPIARDLRPDVIVSEQAELAGPIVAAILGVPNVTHAFGGLLPGPRVESAAREVAPLWERHGLKARPYAGTYDHLYLDIYPSSLQAADGRHVPLVQPLRPVAFATGEPEPLPDWITADALTPLVYVTFGTVFNANPSLISIVVAALRERPLRVVVTVGPGADPALLGSQPANVHVARYIPQTQLLDHCAAVASHAGSGTLLAALAYGLPQLCLPQAADQFETPGHAQAPEPDGPSFPEPSPRKAWATGSNRFSTMPPTGRRRSASATRYEACPNPPGSPRSSRTGSGRCRRDSSPSFPVAATTARKNLATCGSPGTGRRPNRDRGYRVGSPARADATSARSGRPGRPPMAPAPAHLSQAVPHRVGAQRVTDVRRAWGPKPWIAPDCSSSGRGSRRDHLSRCGRRSASGQTCRPASSAR